LQNQAFTRSWRIPNCRGIAGGRRNQGVAGEGCREHVAVSAKHLLSEKAVHIVGHQLAVTAAAELDNLIVQISLRTNNGFGKHD
jgi:hypothetical protein